MFVPAALSQPEVQQQRLQFQRVRLRRAAPPLLRARRARRRRGVGRWPLRRRAESCTTGTLATMEVTWDRPAGFGFGAPAVAVGAGGGTGARKGKGDRGTLQRTDAQQYQQERSVVAVQVEVEQEAYSLELQALLLDLRL